MCTTADTLLSRNPRFLKKVEKTLEWSTIYDRNARIGGFENPRFIPSSGFNPLPGVISALSDQFIHKQGPEAGVGESLVNRDTGGL